MKYDALGYYQLLQVSPQSGDEQIKQSYRELAKFWHPDHNTAANALENFQRLSVAYEVLKTPESRLGYDLLSMVYVADNYPDYETIAPIEDIAGDANVRAFYINHVRGYIWKYKLNKELKILSQNNACKYIGKSALANWILGWWSPQSFGKNIMALYQNYNNSFAAQDSFRVLLHNIIAYQKNGNISLAVASAIAALELGDGEEKAYIERFITMAGIRVQRPKAWNLTNIKFAQLIFPLCVAVIVSFSMIKSPERVKNWWGDSKEIAYYQEVNSGYQKRMVDDVVVGKIHNIPVNKSDINRLYHLQTETTVMHGPSEDFDVLKTLPEKTTVRLTGYSPDNVWARILIDNGEMGFVKMKVLEKGIGKEVPFGSAVYEE